MAKWNCHTTWSKLKMWLQFVRWSSAEVMGLYLSHHHPECTSNMNSSLLKAPLKNVLTKSLWLRVVRFAFLLFSFSFFWCSFISPSYTFLAISTTATTHNLRTLQLAGVVHNLLNNRDVDDVLSPCKANFCGVHIFSVICIICKVSFSMDPC